MAWQDDCKAQLMQAPNRRLKNFRRSSNMPRVVPSQVVAAIDSMFGANRHEYDEHKISFQHRDHVRSLLSLLDLIPDDILTPSFDGLTEYLQCRSSLISALSIWDVGDTQRSVVTNNGRNPVVKIRAILATCPDEHPPVAAELSFIPDAEAREHVQDQIRAAWVDFRAEEWTGATIFGAAVAEALLFWALKNHTQGQHIDKLDKLHLSDYVKQAEKLLIITSATASQAALANDSRNLIHAGRVARTGLKCNKATALTSLAAMQRLLDELTG